MPCLLFKFSLLAYFEYMLKHVLRRNDNTLNYGCCCWDHRYIIIDNNVVNSIEKYSNKENYLELDAYVLFLEGIIE